LTSENGRDHQAFRVVVVNGIQRLLCFRFDKIFTHILQDIPGILFQPFDSIPVHLQKVSSFVSGALTISHLISLVDIHMILKSQKITGI